MGKVAPGAAAWLPAERALSALCANAPQTILHTASAVHLLLMAVFFVWIPNSKHLHIVLAWPDIFFAGTEWIRGKTLSHSPSPVDLEQYEAECEKALDRGDETLPTIGLREFADTTAKQRLEAFTCTLCKRCATVCPMIQCGLAQKSPMDALVSLRKMAVRSERQRPGNTALIGELMDEDALWNCTQCGACDRSCPFAHEHTQRIMMMRQNAVTQQENVPPRLLQMFTKIERSGNPWGYPARERTKLQDELAAEYAETTGVSENKPPSRTLPKIAIFSGCMASYDRPSTLVHAKVVRWLKNSGFEIVTLPGETCCGEPLRKAGNEPGFVEQAQKNTAILNKTGAELIITTCPHCAATLNDSYRPYGLHIPALHIMQFWIELERTGALEIQPKATGTLAIHLPCYLSKYEDLTRDCVRLLEKAGLDVRQTGNAARSLCCGAGGARFFFSDDRSIPNKRAAELKALNAEYAGTLCHFCRQMIGDTLQNSASDTFTECRNVVDVLPDCVRLKTGQGMKFH